MSDGEAPARRSGGWQLASSARSRLVAGAALVLLGLLAGRFDVAAIGVPLALAVLRGLANRPSGTSDARLHHPRYVSRRSEVASTLAVEPAVGITALRLRVSAPAHRDVQAVVDLGGRREVTLSYATARTGRLHGPSVAIADIGVEAALTAGPRVLGPGTLLVLPRNVPLNELPLPPQLQGLTGTHRTTRPGDGGELRDVAVFGAGDRLRRIDWKTTARRAGTRPGPGGGLTELYVRRTFAMADAHVVLLLDSRDALGPDVSTWGAGPLDPRDATSLDIARIAAASLARTYIDRGDRVGLVDLGRPQRRLRPAGGRRHLSQIVHQLALAEPPNEATRTLRTPLLPSGVLVVMLSTFLDDASIELARELRYGGHRTIALDVLPRLVTDLLSPRTKVAFRIVSMERADRLAALRAAGVELVSWDDRTSGHGGPSATLTALARTRRSRR